VATVTEIFEFDVAVSTHDLLQQGITEATYVRVRVMAETVTEAEIVACQMAMATGGMPTDLYHRI
jgi:hypothetical protein